ncbi:MAG: hypothetical protein K2M20_10880 [Lachnospiraceae bacterium]|nr:hypothetical protein [Lachnospiraceae bacterium]
MKNKNNAKYYMLIMIFTILFFCCMAFCFGRFRELARDYRTRSLSYRLEGIELDENMFGPAHNFFSLYFGRDYEEEFDGYWAFADAYLAYMRGRISEEKEPYIREIKSYLETGPGGVRAKTAENYVEELEKQ